jgi:hypothetical protein
LGVGGLGLGGGAKPPKPQSPIPNPQSPIPNKNLYKCKLLYFNYILINNIKNVININGLKNDLI